MNDVRPESDIKEFITVISSFEDDADVVTA